jgi:glycosyltransferase involved in cell wall biosynthesis
MPAYNAALYIEDAIRSVTNQTHGNWELIIINDGSTDATEEKVKSITDVRIRYYKQSNKGVSAARNEALQHIQGDYFCFLDADDLYPVKSLESRLEVFETEPAVDFVDGAVIYKNSDLSTELKKHVPSFRGQPYNELLRINTACLFGNTWMIKRKQGINYGFEKTLSYAEDLYFYLSVSKNGGLYSYTETPVLIYRRHNNSAMVDSEGLEKGYRQLYWLVKHELKADKKQLMFLKYKISRIMFATYLKGERKPVKALQSIIHNVRL